MADEQHQKVAEIIKSARVAMMTQVDSTGRLVSHPMATQDVDFDGTVWFIAERSSDKVRDLTSNPQVNLAYSGNGAWVSLSGTARVVDDRARLEELWGTFTDTWMEGGPDNPENVLIEVTGDTAEYWDAPGGSKVIQLANLVRSAVKGERLEGDNEVVDL